MTINIKNFLSDKTKLSKCEFQNLKQIEGLEMFYISRFIQGWRDDLRYFIFQKEQITQH